MCLDAVVGSCRHGNSTVYQFFSNSLLQFCLQSFYNVQCSEIIDDYAVPKYICRLFLTGNGIVFLIQHHHYDVCGTQIQTDFQFVSYRSEGLCLGFGYPFHVCLYPLNIHLCSFTALIFFRE